MTRKEYLVNGLQSYKGYRFISRSCIERVTEKLIGAFALDDPTDCVFKTRVYDVSRSGRLILIADRCSIGKEKKEPHYPVLMCSQEYSDGYSAFRQYLKECKIKQEEESRLIYLRVEPLSSDEIAAILAKVQEGEELS